MSGLLAVLPVGVPLAADKSSKEKCNGSRLSRSRRRRNAHSRERRTAMAQRQRINADGHFTDVNMKTEHQEEPQTKPVETFAPPSCAPREIFVPPSCSPRQLHRCELMPELPPSSEILAADRPGILLGGEGC
eukprot:gnl/TRDRNA2_/TRDRNA2_176959_c10_seq3.p2 gnl/TRDRNA2_/TRDRNA2_176959_c10~~gnl/TRDRNA2_/TRDRNA2_176959_c10_seq3.p2  ORF type:complete len:132 (-),score=24.05 gnl/TRDRNA2_/TRDRNA2_176959_c10_seq3:425-820(-)